MWSIRVVWFYSEIDDVSDVEVIRSLSSWHEILVLLYLFRVKKGFTMLGLETMIRMTGTRKSSLPYPYLYLWFNAATACHVMAWHVAVCIMHVISTIVIVTAIKNCLTFILNICLCVVERLSIHLPSLPHGYFSLCGYSIDNWWKFCLGFGVMMRTKRLLYCRYYHNYQDIFISS